MPRGKYPANHKPRHGYVPPVVPQTKPQLPPTTPADHEKCYLLNRLPPELRTKIYRLVVPPPTLLYPSVWILFKAAERREYSKNPTFYRTHERVLALARTCRQLNSEVLPIYYGENAFSFYNAYDLYRYLYMIGLERRRCIKHIELLLVGGFRHQAKTMKNSEVFKLAFDVLADCYSLRKLYIGVSDETIEGIRTKAKNRGSLLAVRQWDVFDAVRGLDDLNLRIREVWDWGPYAVKWFEKEAKDGAGKFNSGLWIKVDEIEEFEKALAEDFKRPREESDEEEEDEEDEGEGKEGEIDDKEIECDEVLTPPEIVPTKKRRKRKASY